MKRFVLITLCALLWTATNAQNHHILGLFPTYNQNGHLSEKLDYSIYSFLAIHPFEQSVTDDTFQDFIYEPKINAAYIELDLIYNINPRWSTAASYTYEGVNLFNEPYRNEHRVWLQVQHYNKLPKWRFKNRVRYDFRFVEDVLTGDFGFKPRVRYLIGVDKALNVKSLYFAAYNEFFFDTFDSNVQLYSENWAFAGIGFNLTKRSKIETGPLIISWIRNGSNDWLNQYFLQMTLIAQFDVFAKA